MRQDRFKGLQQKPCPCKFLLAEQFGPSDTDWQSLKGEDPEEGFPPDLTMSLARLFQVKLAWALDSEEWGCPGSWGCAGRKGPYPYSLC